MILYPPAKINLGLRVTKKLNDGYHAIDTVMYAIPWLDILEVVPSDEFKFTSSGLAIDGESSNNLCVKAYNRMKKETDNSFPVHIHLHKQIPMGAGLGGGSSDAASTLLALNELWKANLTDKQLEAIAGELGSDCPFFIQAIASYCTSKGEKMEHIKLDLSGYWIKLIYPSVSVSTGEAYQKITPKEVVKTSAACVLENISQWKKELINDFEAPIFNLHPSLEKIKQDFYNEGAIYASMSGSGSVIFGVFTEKPTENKLISSNNSIQKIFSL